MKIQGFLLMCVLLVIGLFLQNCKTEAKGVEDTVEVEGTEFEGTSFGAGINADSYQDFGEVISSLKGKEEVATTFKATVNEVCQAKGCWMTLSAAGQPEMMVKFKDYGFFMPKDISGREVIVQGKAFREVTPVDELQHYAEDAGKSKEEIAAITEPKEELKFEATGVLLLEKS